LRAFPAFRKNSRVADGVLNGCVFVPVSANLGA